MRCNTQFQLRAAAPQPRSGNSVVLLAVGLSAAALLVAGAAAFFLVSAPQPDPGPSVVTREVVVAEPVPAPEPNVPPEVDVVERPEPSAPPEVEVVKTPPPKVEPPTEGPLEIRTQGAHFRGPEDAPVTIVLITDFECPFCQRINKTLDEVEHRYEGKVRFAYMHNPLGFHKGAMPAAKAAIAADAQGKFWEMYLKLFENRKALTPQDIRGYAKELDLDMSRFDETIADSATERRIKAHQAEAKRLDARGTPTSFINGRMLKGAQSVEAFAKIIDEELDAAK